VQAVSSDFATEQSEPNENMDISDCHCFAFGFSFWFFLPATGPQSRSRSKQNCIACMYYTYINQKCGNLALFAVRKLFNLILLQSGSRTDFPFVTIHHSGKFLKCIFAVGLLKDLAGAYITQYAPIDVDARSVLIVICEHGLTLTCERSFAQI
jgi:hypothetical protein